MPVGYGAISARFRGGAQSGSHRSFPPPAHRTRRADFPHRALQWDHAPRTRNAEPGTYAGPVVCCHQFSEAARLYPH